MAYFLDRTQNGRFTLLNRYANPFTDMNPVVGQDVPYPLDGGLRDILSIR